MNILFIFSLDFIYTPRKPITNIDNIQFGISYISALLKKHGHTTSIVVLNQYYASNGIQTVLNKITQFKPDLLCFSSVSTQYDFILKIASVIKNKHPNIYQLIGGPHASLCPEDVIKGPFDALCIGEGEHPVVGLVSMLQQGINPAKIANLWIKHNAVIEKNSPRPFINDLDTFPFPDRELWVEWIATQPLTNFSLLLGRGCPFECTYCCNHVFKQLATGTYVRYRSVDNIVREIIELEKHFPKIQSLYLEVETIALRKEWVHDLCHGLQKHNETKSTPLMFGTNLRVTPNCDFDDLFREMRKANFTYINIGLESGSERIRRDVLKRNYSNTDILRTVSAAKANGLKVTFYNLIGVPGETLDDFEMTVQMNREAQPDHHFTSIFFPYPGTDLYKTCLKGELLSPSNKTQKIERMNALIDSVDFPRKTIKHKYLWFNYYIHKEIHPLPGILLHIFFVKLGTHPKLWVTLNQLSSVPAIVFARKSIGKILRRVFKITTF